MLNKAPAVLATILMRVSALLGPRVMRLLARINKRVTNPLQRLWAPRLPYYALIEHTGRKSGRKFTTPVLAFVENDSLSVLLLYGVESDWVRNVRAARSAAVVHRSKRYLLTDPRIVAADSLELPQAVRTKSATACDVLIGTLRTDDETRT